MKLMSSMALVLVCLSTTVMATTPAPPPCSMEFPAGIMMLCLEGDEWEILSPPPPALMAFSNSSAPGSVIELLPGTLPTGQTNRADPVSLARWLAEALRHAERPLETGERIVLFNRQEPPVFKVRNDGTPGQTDQLVSPVFRGARVQIVRTFREGSALGSKDFEFHSAFIASIIQSNSLLGGKVR